MLTVEDGSGVEGADTYASVDEATDYIERWHEPRAWDEADAPKRERALRQGSRYVDAHRFRGRRKLQRQSMAWPRCNVGVVDGREVLSSEVPPEVKHAAIEAALRYIRGEDLFPDHDGATVSAERSKAGPVQTETQYATPRRRTKRFEAILALLRPYLSSSRLERSIA